MLFTWTFSNSIQLSFTCVKTRRLTIVATHQLYLEVTRNCPSLAYDLLYMPVAIPTVRWARKLLPSSSIPWSNKRRWHVNRVIPPRTAHSPTRGSPHNKATTRKGCRAEPERSKISATSSLREGNHWHNIESDSVMISTKTQFFIHLDSRVVSYDSRWARWRCGWYYHV